MGTNAVSTRLALTVAEVKALLGLTAAATWDGQITLFLAAGKEEADRFTNNPFLRRAAFTQDDFLTPRDHRWRDPLIVAPITVTPYTEPAVELDIPEVIKLGVVEYVRGCLHLFARGALVSREKVDDVERSFAVYASIEDLLQHVRGTYWRSSRLQPGTPVPEGYWT